MPELPEQVRRCDAKVRPRCRIEYDIVEAFVKKVFSKGFTVEIDNGGEEGEEEEYASVEAAMKEIMQTDEERIYVCREDGIRIGWIYCVYGNNGWDVISDYTVNLENYKTESAETINFLEEAEALSDTYSE